MYCVWDHKYIKQTVKNIGDRKKKLVYYRTLMSFQQCSLISMSIVKYCSCVFFLICSCNNLDQGMNAHQKLIQRTRNPVHIVTIHEQVRLVRLVHLQTDNFHLFLRQQMDKWQTSVWPVNERKQIKENCLGFCFPELTETGNFCLFAVNGKPKRQSSVCLLQTKI